MSYIAVPGYIVIDGYQPDGDTVRFIADETRIFLDLPRARSDAFGKDTSICVRLEGIDAPELHYEGCAQPHGDVALDALLNDIAWASAKTIKGEPRGIRATVLTRSCDVHGRVIGYLFTDPSLLGERASTLEDTTKLGESVNAHLLRRAVVYTLAYRSQPSPHRTLFRAIAEDARKAGVGVWAKDRSNAGFPLRSDSSLGPHGALVFPKIFRRSVAFFREHAPSESFKEWLKLKSGVDDEVRASEGGWRRLSDLIDERDGVLRLIDDPTSLVFAEA